MLQRYVI